MSRIALAFVATAAVGLAGCQQTATNDGGVAVEINGQKVEEGARDLGNRAKEVARGAGNLAKEFGNDLRPVGKAAVNGAKAAYNEVREEIRGIGNSQ